MKRIPRLRISIFFVLAAAAMVIAKPSAAAVTTTFYGDDDGFGIGATSGIIDPTVSNASGGEAPFTDIRLIASGPFFGPAFKPTGSFGAFSLPGGETVVDVTLTMRAGAWDHFPPPLEGVPHAIILDGVAIPTSFFDLFVNTGGESVGGNLVETRSVSLGPSFFALVADGAVSLNGSILSERSGSESFQIDFLRLDVTTQGAAVPEPATLTMFGLGALGFAGAAIRRRKRAA